MAWKQIGTGKVNVSTPPLITVKGFRKWILRYIADCGGQKRYEYHSSRLNKVHHNVKNAYDTLSLRPKNKN